MREIDVLAVEVRQGPAEIGIAEDDVELVVVGQAAQVVFFTEPDAVRPLRLREPHEPRSRRHVSGTGFFGHGGHSRGSDSLMDDEDVLARKEVVVKIDDGIEAEVMELIRCPEGLLQILSGLQAGR